MSRFDFGMVLFERLIIIMMVIMINDVEHEGINNDELAIGFS